MFYLNLNNYKGNMRDISILIEYSPWNKVGFGAGYNSFNVNINSQKENQGILPGNLVGNVGYKHSGILLFAALNFCIN